MVGSQQTSWSVDVMFSLFFLWCDSTSRCQMTSRFVSVLSAIWRCISLPKVPAMVNRR
jgi:hypothetical protein